MRVNISIGASKQTVMASTYVDGEYSVYVGNLDPATSLSDMEDLIYELFLQVSRCYKIIAHIY